MQTVYLVFTKLFHEHLPPSLARADTTFLVVAMGTQITAAATTLTNRTRGTKRGISTKATFQCFGMLRTNGATVIPAIFERSFKRICT